MLSKAFSHLENGHLKDLVYIFFNDLRVSLYCKRYFITDALEDSEREDSWKGLLSVLENVRTECESGYLEKVGELTEVLKDCLKSVHRGRISESKRDVSFPFKMFPNTKLLEDLDMEETDRIPS